MEAATSKEAPKIMEMPDLLLVQEARRLKYFSGRRSRNVHWGQRKLLIAELEFFTLHWDEKKVPHPICLYAGAAPGIHVPVLSKLFPAFVFHLYDPRDFEIKQSEKIFLHQEFFTDEVAAQWAGRDDVFFVSDIRRAGPEDARAASVELLRRLPVGAKYSKRELDTTINRIVERNIVEDMACQEKWVRLINPVESLLKFHLPYILTEKDAEGFSYLDGRVYLQVWPGRNSTETRLVPRRNEAGEFVSRLWDPLWYEEALFYHNAVVREEKSFLNPFSCPSQPQEKINSVPATAKRRGCRRQPTVIFSAPDQRAEKINSVPALVPFDGEELLNDFDSTAEALILNLYLRRFNRGASAPKIRQLSRYITSNISKDGGSISLIRRRLSTQP